VVEFFNKNNRHNEYFVLFFLLGRLTMKKIVGFCILVLLISASAFPQTAVSLDAALKNSTSYLNGRIPPRTKVVVLNFTSDWAKLSDYVIEELIGYIVNEGTLTVVDRQNLETIRKEMDFQLSGEVSDDTAQSIGKKLGAQTIISGAITAIGKTYRLRIRAISVETAQILGMQNIDVAQDSRITALTKTQSSPAVSSNNASNKTSNNTVTANTPNAIESYIPVTSDIHISTDADSKGKSTGTFNINKELINGIEYTVINLTITLNKGIEYPWGELRIRGSLSENARNASGIRFKVYGDGKTWEISVRTEETLSDYSWYRYKFDTSINKDITIDIPYSKLKQADWGKKVLFNKNTIFEIAFGRNSTIGTGSSQIKIFDIELY
jgi:TolB-like protein